LSRALLAAPLSWMRLCALALCVVAGLSAAAPCASAQELAPGELTFSRACEPGVELTIGAVGDVLIHHELQIQAWREPDRFGALWRGVADLIAAPDLAYANLEGPTARALNRKGKRTADPGQAFDNDVYTGYPRFNYHPDLVKDLVSAGFDVVSTANNHALDRGSLGADLTIDALEAEGLAFSGTKRKGEARAWHVVTESKGFRVAWVACAENTNGIADEFSQVLSCAAQEAELLKLVHDLSEGKGKKRAGAVDAVIVTPHWGGEYSHDPNARQRKLAHDLIDAGATAVIGNHPHVIQPWEKYTTKRGREALIMYSIGNFVSHQPELSKRSTALVYFGLKRSAASGDVFVSGARYIPLHTRHDPARDFYYTEAMDRVRGFDDARFLIVSLMGAGNLLAPGEPLVMAPRCVAEAPTDGSPTDGSPHQDP
jgi:hypothetical protein